MVIGDTFSFDSLYQI